MEKDNKNNKLDTDLSLSRYPPPKKTALGRWGLGRNNEGSRFNIKGDIK